ncbi:O-antigen ligase [Paenibacillus sophorae]|uniref:O-antigen ligase n=1 Tax=Paenibacillus sophorae TaxID=1333845 RepID=A0A1H8I0D2_9BACL|nr:O-antigen ligase family protein [Paenibacillus sophorae]QWU15815.1 O-antigen ligase family protein [Paenibacillus sophorae]SEN61969.1 O-antigen ligase [Paenibacillus sophorae]
MANPVYGKKAAQSRNAEKIPDSLWVLVIGFILFLFWAPFQVGLFNGQQTDYEKPIYLAVLLGCLMLFFWVALYYKRFKLEDQRDLLAVAVLLLPLTYFLSLFVAASHYMAMNMLLIQSMYAAVFIVSLYLLRQKQVNVIIQTAVLTVAYLIVWFGLMNWLGAWNVAGGLIGWFSNTVRGGKYLDAVLYDTNLGPRLTSIFQYANTYAGFLMAFLLVAIFALIRSKKAHGALINGFMLVPIIVSLLLTLSRGGLVMLPVAFVLLLLFEKPARQILWIIYLIIAGIASLAVISPVTKIGQRLSLVPDPSAAVKGWAYLLITSAVTAVLCWAVQRFAAPRLEASLGRGADRRFANLWLPIGATVLVALAAYLLIGTSVRSILPDNIEARLENINFQQHSVLERFTFYKDALKVVKDYPILGAGGGGWAALYEKYQNNPYTSRQAHNFFLQYLIEVGILGFIVFMGFILYVFYKYIRGFIKQKDKDDYENGFFYLILTLSILLHSVLDFNMSYVFMGLLVFIGLAGMAAVMDAKPLAVKWNSSGLRLGYMALACIGAAAVLIVSLRYIGSANAAADAKAIAQISQSYEEIKAPLIKTLKNRPSHPESVIILSSMDNQVYSQNKNEQFAAESLAVLTRGLKDEPNNKQMLKQLIALYDLQGKPDEAYAVYRDNADKYKWDIEWYEPLITRSFDLGNQAFTQKDSTKEQQYFETGLAAYEHVVAGVAYLKTLPAGQMQGRPFAVTPAIALSAGKMQLMTGKTADAAATLKQGLSDDYNDTANREVTRYYLAALQKDGQQDQGVYDKLIQADAAEKAKIEEIVAAQY